MEICQLTVHGFTYLAVHQKTNEDRVYTPMGGSPNTNVTVYAQFGVLPKLKVNIFTPVVYCTFKGVTQDIKNT